MGLCVSTTSSSTQDWKTYDNYLYATHLEDPSDIAKYHIYLNFKEKKLNHLGQEQEEMSQDIKYKLKKALKGSVHEVLRNEFVENNDHQNNNDMLPPLKSKQSKCIANMANINELNWQWVMVQNKKFDDDRSKLADQPLGDIESIELGQKLLEINANSSIEKRLAMPNKKLTANLYSSVIVNSNGEHKAIKKAEDNIRELRIRPETDLSSEFQCTLDYFDKKKTDFAKEWAAYGIQWAIKVKGDKKNKKGQQLELLEFSCPSFQELIDGVINWNVEQLKSSMEDQSIQEQTKVMKARTKILEMLTNGINIEDTKEPFKVDENAANMDSELSLLNPYSKIVSFILYLCSMEFGSPPLFAEMNRVARTMDESQLTNLGPILRAISVIVLTAENFRQLNDKIKTGARIQNERGGVEDNFAGSFMLFRGAQMTQEQLHPWIENFDQIVKIPGIWRCSQSLKVSLNQCGIGKTPLADHTPVLFVFCIKNYQLPGGIRLSNEAYSAYPGEREALVAEGIDVYVLEIENWLISNKHASFADMNNKYLTIIYLFSDS